MIKFYNSLTCKLQKFRPLKDRVVKIYSCGPTVYNFVHIGNLRAFIFNDLLRRYLEFKGFKVIHVMNITDIDDKTIKGSKKEYPTFSPDFALKIFTNKYEKFFWEDIKKLNIKKPHHTPHATEYIPKMQKFIIKIIKNGFAYERKGSIYFDLSKYIKRYKYGQLVKIDMKGFKKGVRIDKDEYERDQVWDFVLWKAHKKGEPYWDFWINEGLLYRNKSKKKINLKGRPGWHIECSVMGYEILKFPFDIHTGGVDLKFPHHENEIAQDIAAYKINPVRFWLHNEHLLVEGEKMSKSKGNFYTLRDILEKGYSPRAMRLLLLSCNFTQKLDFSFRALKNYEETIESIDEFIIRIFTEVNGHSKIRKEISGLSREVLQNFEKSLDDNLNISEALKYFFEFINKVNIIFPISKKEQDILLKVISKIDSILGLDLIKIAKERINVPKRIKRLMEEREKARKKKNFQKADEIRDKILKQGYIIKDTKIGTVVYRVKKV